MLFFRKKIKPSGFTLIEILIYTAIFGVVAAGIIGVAWNITRLHTTQIASNEIDENLRYVMNLVNSKVRESTMIEQASGTTLILRMPDSTKSPTTFSLSNGTLYIQEGSADPVAITSNRVEVTSLNFEYLSVAGSKGGVRINITMAYKEQPGIASREYLTTVTKVNAITFDSDILPDVNNLRNVGAPNYRWKEGYFSGDVTVQGNVSSSGFIMGGAGLCMGSDCRTSWGQVTGVTGSGTQNYIPKWTSSGAIGNSQIFDNGTNVGIGTTSPGYKLQVAGDIGLGATNSIYFSSKERISANGLGEIGIDYNSGSTATNNFVVYNGSTTALFTVQRAGNVGIGTASPPSLLSVGASSQFQVNSSGDIVKIKNLTYSWPSTHSIGFLKNDGSGNLTWDTSGAVGGTGSAGQIAFWSATTTITGDSGLYWDNANKRLGIGTTAPGQKLSVVGDIGLSGGERFIGTTDAYGLSIRTNNTNRIFISADGNVGIGTTSPGRMLDVHGLVQLRGAPGGSGLFVDSGGNVGIGTTSPSTKLDININSTTYNNEAGGLRLTFSEDPTERLYMGWDNSLGTYGSAFIQSIKSGTQYTPLLLNAAGGNVGIGTTGPGAKLEIAGETKSTSGFYLDKKTISLTTAPKWLRFAQSVGNGGNNAGVFEIRWSRSGVHGHIIFNAGANYGGANGINLNLLGGSTYGSQGITQIRLLRNTTYDLMYLEFYAAYGDATYPNSIEVRQLSGYGWSLLNIVDGSIPAGYTAHTLSTSGAFAVNEDSKTFMITKWGNVGIGTTSPSYKLDVAGDIRLTGTLYANSISGTYSGTVPAAQVTAGTFATGDFTFPSNLIVSNTLTATNVNATSTIQLNGTTIVTSGRALQNLTGISSSGTITLTGLTASRIVGTDASSNLTTSITSAMVANSVSDETGSGALVFGTSPSISGPTLSGTIAGTYTIGGTPTLGASLTGSGSPNITGIGQFSGATGVFSTSVTTPLLTSSGAITIKPGSNSTTAIQLQNSAGTAVVNVDTTNSRVGIATTTPAYPLDVVGDVRFSGTLQGGSVPWARLTSFPSACSAGNAVTGLGSSLTCSPFMSNPMTTLGDIVYGGASGTPTRLAGAAGFLKSTGAAAPSWSAVNLASSDVTGTLAVTSGGTGLSSIAAGSILYATSSNTLIAIAPTAANQVLRSTAANALQFGALVAADIPNLDASKITSGTLPIARGGTNATATPTAGAVAYGTGSAYAFSAAGTANQVLISGGSGAPTWSNIASLLTQGTNITISGTTNATIATVNNPTFSTSVSTPLLTSSGAIAIKPGSNSTTAIQLQNTGGTAIVNVDTTNSRVGINNASPSYALDITGDIRVTGAIIGTVSTTISATNVSAGAFGSNTGGGNYSFPARVGIGTTSPSTDLHIKVSSGDVKIQLGTQASVVPTTGGPNNPSAAVDDSSNGGSAVWSNPTNVYTSNDVYASVTIPAGVDPDYYWSDYLKATGFGFSLPSTANILGIKVEIEAKASVASTLTINEVLLVKSGSIVGSSKSGGLLTASDAYYSFGDTTDLWGTTWSYSDINNSNFGVVVSVFNPTTSARTAYIDHIRITVYYTSSGDADWQMAVSSTSGAFIINPLFSGGRVGIGTTTPSATLDINGTLNVNGIIQGKFYDKYTGSISRTYSSGNGTSSLSTGKYYPDWFCALSKVDATELDTATEHAYCTVTLDGNNQWLLNAVISGVSDQTVSCSIYCIRL